MTDEQPILHAGRTGERKQVTALFASLSSDDLMTLADDDLEQARQIVESSLEVMMKAVHDFGGIVIVRGDGIEGLFGTPLPQADHAIRGCRAALRMQEVFGEYAERVRRTHGASLAIRISLDSGEVVVSSIGADLRTEYRAYGDAVFVAARLQDVAQTGGVLVGEGMARAVRDIARLESAGAVGPRAYRLTAIEPPQG